MSTRTRFAIFAAAVLLLAGILLLATLSGKDADGVTSLRSSTATYTVRLSAGTPRSGPNTFELEITGRGGTPPEATEVVVEPVMPQMGHAFPPVTAAPLAPGRYRAENVALPMPGTWQITVTLRGPNGAEQAAFALLVK